MSACMTILRYWWRFSSCRGVDCRDRTDYGTEAHGRCAVRSTNNPGARCSHRAGRWSQQVVPIQPKGSGPPFFCVDAGPRYLSLARQLGAAQPFLGLLHPDAGVSARATSIESIAAFNVKSIRAVQPEGPYFIGGWSSVGPSCI